MYFSAFTPSLYAPASVYACTFENVKLLGLLVGSVAKLSFPTAMKLIMYGFSSMSELLIEIEAYLEPGPAGLKFSV